MAGKEITIIKLDAKGREVWQYIGHTLHFSESEVVIDARFNREIIETEYVTFRRGDRMVEYFYSNRWYNIFTLHDGESERVKGWYCNITRPAIFEGDSVIYADLALDLWVYPDGRTLLLDEDEFAAENLPDEEVAAAWVAVDTLRGMVANRIAPFDVIC